MHDRSVTIPSELSLDPRYSPNFISLRMRMRERHVLPGAPQSNDMQHRGGGPGGSYGAAEAANNMSFF